jgi:hypothetical protein
VVSRKTQTHRDSLGMNFCAAEVLIGDPVFEDFSDGIFPT